MTLQALFLEATSNDFQSIRIDNPLANQEPAQLEAEVEEFHKRVNLNGVIDLEILIRGARIAQQRWGDAPPGFTPAEFEAIKNENSKSYLSFLRTRGLLVTVMATACAAITQYVFLLANRENLLTLIIGDGSNQQSIPALSF